jgi:hypothetical protein
MHQYTVWAERRILYKDSVRTAQETHSVSVIEISQLMLNLEIIAVCSEIHTKLISILCGQNVELLTLKLCKSLLAVLWSTTDIKAFVFTPLSP